MFVLFGVVFLVFVCLSDVVMYGMCVRVLFGDGMNEYFGIVFECMVNGCVCVVSLSEEMLSGDWDATVRSKLFWVAGLKDFMNVLFGKGNIGYCFNDFNYVDVMMMIFEYVDNKN